MGAKFNLEEFGVDRVKYDATVSYAQEAAKLKIALGRAGVMDQEWKLAFGETPGWLAVDIAIIEFVTHGWDLPRPPPPRSARPRAGRGRPGQRPGADVAVRPPGGRLRPTSYRPPRAPTPTSGWPRSSAATP